MDFGQKNVEKYLKQKKEITIILNELKKNPVFPLETQLVLNATEIISREVSNLSLAQMLGLTTQLVVLNPTTRVLAKVVTFGVVSYGCFIQTITSPCECNL
jgi:hypothetical protein